MTAHFYHVIQAAEKLGISTKTIYRHLALGYFEKVVIIAHGTRNDYLFSEACLSRYKSKYGKPEERVKRVYNRRVIKGKHKR